LKPEYVANPVSYIASTLNDVVFEFNKLYIGFETYTNERGMTLSLVAVLKRIETGLLIANIVVILTFGAIKPIFLSGESMAVLFRFVSVLAIMAIGEMFVIICGGIDLSPGSVIGLTGMVVAGLITYLGMHWLIAVALTFLLGIAIGLWHGFFTTRLSPPMPQIAPAFLVTLGTLIVGRGLAQYFTKGYPIIISAIDQPLFIYLGEGKIFGLPVTVVFLVVVLAVSIYILYLNPLGRHIYSIGGNIEAARVAGVDIHRTRMIAYVIGATLATLSGILFTAMVNAAYPATGGGYELTAISSVAIGGVSLAGGEGTPWGTVLGATLVWSIQTGLVVLNISPYITDIITGVILVAAVGINLYNRIRVR